MSESILDLTQFARRDDVEAFVAYLNTRLGEGAPKIPSSMSGQVVLNASTRQWEAVEVPAPVEADVVLTWDNASAQWKKADGTVVTAWDPSWNPYTAVLDGSTVTNSTDLSKVFPSWLDPKAHVDMPTFVTGEGTAV